MSDQQSRDLARHSWFALEPGQKPLHRTKQATSTITTDPGVNANQAPGHHEKSGQPPHPRPRARKTARPFPENSRPFPNMRKFPATTRKYPHMNHSGPARRPGHTRKLASRTPLAHAQQTAHTQPRGASATARQALRVIQAGTPGL